MHMGSFAGSSLAMFSLFSYYQAYGREDYRHWGRGGGCGGGCPSAEVTSDPQRRSESRLPEGLNAAAGSGYDDLYLPR